MKHWLRKPIAYLLALVLCLSCSVFAHASSTGFTDVPAGAWYEKQLKAMVEEGLISGTSATTFNPAGQLHVSEALVFAVKLKLKLEGKPTSISSESGPWYQGYVDYAKANGILDAKWEPLLETLASRAQMAEILYATTKDILTTVRNTVPDNSIPDVRMGMEGAEAIYAMYRAGVTTGGDGAHNFYPYNPVSRAETAIFLYNILFQEKLASDPSWKPFSLTAQSVPAMPAYDAPVTMDNILAMLDNLDPDGASILRQAMAAGIGEASILNWFSMGGTLPEGYESMFGKHVITSDLNTAVHETYHQLSFTAGWNQQIYYTGSGNSITVTQTDVFDSAEIDAVVPKEIQNLSGGRYGTYISGETAATNMASRQQGVYGIFNEFTAYCWGTVDSLRTYDYTQANSPQMGGDNEWISHAEFRYFILTYMLYAKEHHPDVYNGIMANKNFLRAFKTVDSIFETAVGTLQGKKAAYRSGGMSGSIGGNSGSSGGDDFGDFFDDDFFGDMFGDDFKDFLAQFGMDPEDFFGSSGFSGSVAPDGSSGNIVITSGGGSDPYQSQYDLLQKYLSQPEYVEMLALMKA